MIKTIRGKVTLWCIFIVGTLNLVLSLFIYTTINSKLEDNIAENMQNIKYMAKNITITSFNVNSSADEFIKNSKSLVDSLYNFYGHYINLSIDDDRSFFRGNVLSPESVTAILSESKAKKSLLKFNKVDNYFVATYNYPLYIDTNYLGNLVVQKDYTSQYKENHSIMLSIFVGQIILLLILVLALWMIIGKLTAPIKKLSEAIELFGKGDNIDDIKVIGHDEVAKLTSRFNMMKNQINSQIDEIRQEQRKSREFFNNATHEIKTPITAISGYAQVLLDEDIVSMDEEFRDRALIRMVKESDKLNKLAKNILDISKGNTILQEEKETFDLGELLQSKINDMQVRLIKSNLIINSKLEAIEVNLVKEDISTILTNLLDNAIKYSASDIIEITLLKSDNNFELKISNSVFQLPETIRDNLLAPFIKYTSDEVLQKEGITSSGLGLYLCNQLALKNKLELNYKIINNVITVKLKSTL